MLSREEKLLLCRLSIFVGGWDLEAAEQVCAGSNDISSSDVLDLLTHLVDKSLVILEWSRYRMLETTRQYAREKLLDMEEGQMLRERHLAYFLDLAEKAEQEIHGPNRIDGTNRLELDNDNIRSALDWCVSEGNTEGALRLLGVWTRVGLHHFTKRMLSRHGIMAADRSYDEFQELFHASLRRDVHLYKEYHALFVRAGKTFCRRTKPLCEKCPLHDMLLNGYKRHQKFG